ncbi:hypothetical protein ACFVW1_33825 [Streptomyces olivochromogenes]|uniref:hypothetical protein n=1 Tax=Streptomyces olivochromogenes TaxID=1963 RepID=UPI0036D9B807
MAAGEPLASTAAPVVRDAVGEPHRRLARHGVGVAEQQELGAVRAADLAAHVAGPVDRGPEAECGQALGQRAGEGALGA